MDLYPTLTRLANVPFDATTADLLDGTDLFEATSEGFSNTTTELAQLLVSRGVGNATSYRQSVYPIVEHKYTGQLGS